MLIITLLSTGVLYVQFNDLKIRMDKDKTTFYNLQESRWKTIATEYTKLYNGTKLIYRDEILTYALFDETNKISTYIRDTKYKKGEVISTYTFDGKVTDIELVPVSEVHRILDAEGLIFQYEVRDLKGIKETYSLTGETELRFGKIKITLEKGYYWGTVYKSGIVKVKYKIKTNNETYNIRLFDPTDTLFDDDFLTDGYLNITNWFAYSNVVGDRNVTVVGGNLKFTMYFNSAHNYAILNGTEMKANYTAIINLLNLTCLGSYNILFFIAITAGKNNTDNTTINQTTLKLFTSCNFASKLYNNASVNISTDGNYAALYLNGTLDSNTSISGVGSKKYLMFRLAENSNTKNVTIDRVTVFQPSTGTNSPPTVPNLGSPANNSYTQYQTLNFDFNVTDAESSTLNCILYINSSNYGSNISVRNNTNTIIKNTNSLLNGTYYWNISCSDGSLTNWSVTRIININYTTNVTPTVNLMFPPDNNQTLNTTPTFIFNFTDDRSQANCSLWIDGTVYFTNMTAINNTKTIMTNTTYSLSIATHIWYISCNDTIRRGNSSIRNITIASTQLANISISYCNLSFIQFVPNLSRYNQTTKTITQYNITPVNHTVCDFNISNSGTISSNVSVKIYPLNLTTYSSTMFVVKINGTTLSNTTWTKIITNLGAGENIVLNTTIDYVSANRSFYFNYSWNNT